MYSEIVSCYDACVCVRATLQCPVCPAQVPWDVITDSCMTGTGQAAASACTTGSTTDGDTVREVWTGAGGVWTGTEITGTTDTTGE